MSIEVIKKQIFKFLSSDTPEVMVIKGEWGIGKTFSWKKFLAEAKAENKIKLENYSYVSLFGINSLESLKYTVFENIVDRQLIDKDANINTFKENTKNLTKTLGRQSIKFWKEVPIAKLLIPAIETISFLSLNKTLICIDDLERKGDKINIKDILGLISLLKEQKKCKIVLLLNDEEKGLDDYRKYIEKVVDIELFFAPSPEECADIAYSTEADYHLKLKELTASLGIRNIRILQKIERLVKLSLPLIEDCVPEIIDEIMHSIVLYSWSYFCSHYNDDIPPFDFIKNIEYKSFFPVKDQSNKQETKWLEILRKYNYMFTDELDLIIAEAVKSGFFIDSKLKEKATWRNQQIIGSKSEKKFSDAWEFYHDSFDDNAEQVINNLYESFKGNCKILPPNNLNSLVSIFRDLDEHEKLSELIDFYIENRKDEIELFNLSKINRFGDIKDSELISKFNNIYSKSVITENAKQVLDRIAGTNGWNQNDVVILANTSVEDYYKLFKSEKGKHLDLCIDKCLKFGESLDASEQQIEITNRSTEALKKIAAESQINKRRVKRFIII
ncbi:hypothetical protein [Xenorhabdus budapestensis]|uniref:KAP NTPase domain-containing protein n=1 Tax=Xenorhabdus budapestensis TaxID=290110 RepID=A0A2D0IN61_XENBU|nr:hypothetical protein [Xenorhabdus budapestensis]PHM23273.1 hypothetical protein Xbud_03638 [Xenorhabdus budapestensis]